MESYLVALKKINSVNMFLGKKLSLENMQQMSKLLGNPENSTQYIHVAGTNGKGSVSLKLQKIFQNSGKKCGLYTSPHLFSYTERIKINEQMIEREILSEILLTLFTINEKHKLNLTFFEYLTNVAFIYFKEKKIDLAILETGLGGRIDATNQISSNLASIITGIGIDHVQQLGNTYRQIAGEKAGIIKPFSPTIIGPNAKPIDVFQNVCKNQNSPLFITQGNQESILDYNEENNLIVQNSIQVLKQTYQDQALFQDITDADIQFGINSQQSCRLEQIESQKMKNLQIITGKQFKLFFDVGHNPQGVEKTLQRIRKQYPLNKIKIIFGTSSSKDSLDSLMEISKQASKCFLIQANHYRAKNVEEILKNSEQLKNLNSNWINQVQPIIDNGNIEKTLLKFLNVQYNEDRSNFIKNTNNDNINDSQNQLEQGDIVLIVGSFFIMREIRQFFQYSDDLHDPVELYEQMSPPIKQQDIEHHLKLLQELDTLNFDIKKYLK